MARKQTKKEPFWKQLNTSLEPFQREILGLLVLALAVITLLGLFSVTSGALSDWWTRLLRRFFGWGAYLVAVGLVVAGISMLLSNLGQELKVSWKTMIGLEVLFIVGLALVHLLSFNQDPWLLAESSGGGGFVGWAISSLLIRALGWPIALLILLVILSLGITMVLALRPSLRLCSGQGSGQVSLGSMFRWELRPSRSALSPSTSALPFGLSLRAKLPARCRLHRRWKGTRNRQPR